MTIKRLLKTFARRAGFEVRRISPSISISPHEPHSSSALPYTERDEYGPSNIATKLENIARGQPFEFADILNLNRAVAGMIGNAKQICELGCGTGTFATLAAEDASRQILASEFDEATHRWVEENKPRKNVRYVHGPVPADAGPFDLVVAIEVIEHVADYPHFLKTCCELAPRALLTTPNRARGPKYFHSGPPPYIKHVREWTAGEFFWVLRAFYEDVKLYALTSQSKPEFIAVDVDTPLSPLVADCTRPRCH